MTSIDENWTGERAARWLREAAGLERQLAPVSDVLFAAADLQPGERVLDVGCGTGPTTRQAAAAVGPTGRVTGIDISPELLAAAAANPIPGASTDWVTADVTTWTPPAAAYDVVLSRFGVMFFADPAAAFAHLAEATRPGGRLTMAVWGPRPASPLFEVPLQAVLGVLAARGVSEPDGLAPDGGPFSLSDPAATARLLEDAGWRDVRHAEHVLPMLYGGGLDAAAAAEAATGFGPARIAVEPLDTDARAAAVAAMTTRFTEHLDGEGHVVLDGFVRVVTARRG
ncbi:class I SAM-dependent methyltransferase [Pseudonocardia sp. CA-107938]|uniref:class I SAM-dependent methyltransferase n=1 Tax=Pseudonocardia sp. CA-107938 TaxID=3240021 RepID=UPI003D8C8BCC